MTSVLLFPLDTIKTKLQTFPGVYSGVGGCFRKVVGSQGFLSLYKGLTPHFVTIVADNSIAFMTFAIWEDVLAQHVYT